MLSVHIDEVNGIALLEPDGPLTEDDFQAAARVIDPWIEQNKELRGLIIHTPAFPGWESFAALSSHLVFVREHHKKIDRLAFATDSKIGGFAERIAKHFVKAEMKLFSYQDLERARLWVAGEADDSV